MDHILRPHCMEWRVAGQPKLVAHVLVSCSMRCSHLFPALLLLPKALRHCSWVGIQAEIP